MSRIAGQRSFRYPLFEAEGSPYELGRRHGELARLKINGMIGWLCESLGCSEKELGRRATRFEKVFEKNCPHLVDEVSGLAEGAGIRFQLALACQLRGELGELKDGACTTFAVSPRITSNGHTLIGQTSDAAPEIREFSYVLHLRPANGPEMIMCTFGGMLGYHGVNEHGIAHFANSLGGGPQWQFGLSHYPLKRLILEQSSLDDVQELIHGYPVCSNGNYMIADGRGSILNVEMTPTGSYFVREDSSGCLAHTNHFLTEPHACVANFDQSLPDSFNRLDRMRMLIEQQSGRVNLERMQRALADHDGHPVSICRHPHDGPENPILPNSGHTVAAVIAEPQRGRLHVSSGNPCEYPFVEYRLSGFA